MSSVLTWLGLPVEFLLEPPAWVLLEADDLGAPARQAVVALTPGGMPVMVPMADLLVETSTAGRLVTCVTPGGHLEDG